MYKVKMLKNIMIKSLSTEWITDYRKGNNINKINYDWVGSLS